MKTTLHPLSFTTAFIMAAASTLTSNESASTALKIISASAGAFGFYNLYTEGRLKKGFIKAQKSLTNCLSSFWSQPPSAHVENTNDKSKQEKENIDTAVYNMSLVPR